MNRHWHGNASAAEEYLKLLDGTVVTLLRGLSPMRDLGGQVFLPLLRLALRLLT